MTISKKMARLTEATYVQDKDLKGLSWNELVVLKDRGILTPAQQRKAGIRAVPQTGGQVPPKGARVLEPEEPEEYDESLYEDEDGSLYEEDDSEEEDSDSDSEEDMQDYSDWKKNELQDEIDERNNARDEEHQLLREGKVDELRQRLIGDDAAQAEAQEGA